MFEHDRRATALSVYAEQDESGETRDALAALGLPSEPSWEQRIFLPRGSAESCFAPRQYYYIASRNGAVPSWAAAAQDLRRQARLSI